MVMSIFNGRRSSPRVDLTMSELILQTTRKGRPSTQSLKNLLKQVSASQVSITASAFDDFKKNGQHIQAELDASSSRAKEVKGELLRKIIAQYADHIASPAISYASDQSHSDSDSECNMRRNSFSTTQSEFCTYRDARTNSLTSLYATYDEARTPAPSAPPCEESDYPSEIAKPPNSIALYSSPLASFLSDISSHSTTRANSLASLRSASISEFSILSTNSGSGRRIDKH